jgi:uncharacterized protein YcfJ
MSAVSPESNVSARSLSAVPHAVWIGGGLLCAVTAGLASALVMRTAPEPVAVAPGASPAAVVATAATPLAGISTRPVAPVASAAAKATRPSKPIAASTTPTEASTPTRIATTPAALCASCGVVGHQVGGGNGKTAMTVLGAIGGGLAGHEVEKRVRSETRYDVKVRMEDGSSRVFHQAQSIAVGTRVVADGSALKVARDNAASDEPRMVRTSAPTAGRS